MNAELITELRGHIREVPLTLLHDAAAALEAADKRIAELEAQLPKDGEWIWEDSVCSPRTCSVCKQKFYIGRGWNYCPNCGARMQTVTDCHILNEKGEGGRNDNQRM